MAQGELLLATVAQKSLICIRVLASNGLGVETENSFTLGVIGFGVAVSVLADGSHFRSRKTNFGRETTIFGETTTFGLREPQTLPPQLVGQQAGRQKSTPVTCDIEYSLLVELQVVFRSSVLG